jgi:hypothetical protein
LRVVSLVRTPSLVILKSFSGYAERKNENKRRDCAERLKGRDDGNALEYGTEKKVNVRIAAEL